MTELKRTDELAPGDRLRIDGRLVRTVDRVIDSGYLNHRNETIFSVLYAEGQTPEWGRGNTGIASTEWELA